MKKNIIPKNVSINLGRLIKAGGSPIDFYLPKSLCNRIKFNTLNGILYSYPVCKNGEYYELSTEVNPNMICCNWGSGKEWSCRLTDIIYPMALRLKQEYDVMEANTKQEENPMLLNEVRTGDEYECYHSLYDIWIDGVIVDTDNMTVVMIVGS